MGWTEREMEQRRKGDPAKVQLALEWRSRTTMTLRWIVQRLSMGTRGHLALASPAASARPPRRGCPQPHPEI
jgi:hypothetical protein